MAVVKTKDCLIDENGVNQVNKFKYINNILSRYASLKEKFKKSSKKQTKQWEWCKYLEY